MKTEQQMIADCDYDGLMEQNCDYCNLTYYDCRCPMVKGGHPWHRINPKGKGVKRKRCAIPSSVPGSERMTDCLEESTATNDVFLDRNELASFLSSTNIICSRRKEAARSASTVAPAARER